MAIPKTCKAAVAESANSKLVIKEVPVNQPGPGEVLIKVHACGVCHSDSVVMGGAFGDATPFPLIPGHEIVGTIVAVGEGEKKWKEGNRAGGPWHGGHDGVCTSCNRGLYQMCDNEAINGVTRNGGYTEYCILRSEAVVGLPEDIDASQIAPLLCAGVTTFNGIRQMNIRSGGTVAVLGLGGLGHLALQYSRKLGYRTVALSSSGSKKQFATDLGATDYIDSSKEDTVKALQKMGGVDLLVATSPNLKDLGSLLGGCAPMGKVLTLSLGEFGAHTSAMITKGISIHGWPSGHALDSEETVAFSQREDVQCMIEKFPLDKAQEALDHMLSGKARFRAVLVMD